METTITKRQGAQASRRDRAVVLAVLDKRERELFFGGGRPSAGDAEIVDITAPVTRHWEELLREVDPDVLLSCWSTPSLPAAPSGVLSRLGYICHLCGSVRGIVPRALLERGVQVSNWGGLIAPDVAEHALLMILASLRRLTRWHEIMQHPFAEQQKEICGLRTRALRRQRVGLHGFGMIARELVKLLQPFGMECLVYSEGVPEAYIHTHGARAAASLKELFSESDVLVECEALTESSRGSVTRELLALLPNDAVFVNVGRGAVVDEDALCEAAARGRLRLASDVFAREPLKAEDMFWNARQGIYSPHIGGPTHDGYRECGELAIRNIRRFLEGSEVQGLITLDAYDRMT